MVPVNLIMPAAGLGTRMGTDVKKQFLELEGKPILTYTLEVFHKLSIINDIIITVSPGDEEFCRENIVQLYEFNKVSQVVSGGFSRQESVFNGLKALSKNNGIVLIHDGVRPLIEEDKIELLVNSALTCGAATLAVPPKDTVKLADSKNNVLKTIPREELWLTQTPQAFQYKIIMKAHANALSEGISGTDDASLVEAAGFSVRIIEGSYENIKITTPEDMMLAKIILNRRRSLCG